MTVTVDGVLLTPAYNLAVAGEGSALSARHVGYRYGADTTWSISCDNAVGDLYLTEDADAIPAIYLTYGTLNSNTRAKFGSTSVLIPSSGHFALPTGYCSVNQYADFSIEFWMFAETLPSSLLTTSIGTFGITSGKLSSTQTYPTVSGVTTITTYTWHHIAFTRQGNQVRMFLDGAYEASYIANGSFTLQEFQNGSGRWYLDSIGFSNHYAHWTDSFAIPTQPFNVVPTSSGVTMTQPSAFYPGTPHGSLLTPTEYDQHWDKVVLLLGTDGVYGTNGAVDLKGARSLHTSGYAQVVSDTKYAGSSLLFNGSSTVVGAHDASLDLNYGDFTIEAWVKLNSHKDAYILSRNGESSGHQSYWLSISSSGVPTFSVHFSEDPNTTTVSITGATMSLNTWTHIAVSRTGTIYRIWVNGALGQTLDSAKTIHKWVRIYDGYESYSEDCGLFFVGGGNPFGASGCINGYIEGLRVTNGFSRYQVSETISIPTGPFVAAGSGSDGDPYWTDVKSLIGFDEPDGTTYNIRDAKGNTVTLIGDAVVRRNFGGDSRWSSSSYSSKSVLFGGSLSYNVTATGAGFSIPYSSDFDLSNSNDFTIEFVIKEVAASSQNRLVCCFTNTPNNIGWAITWTNNMWTTGDIYFQWSQWTTAGVQDIATGPINTFVDHRWTHVAVQRRGDTITVYMDGEAGTPVTTTRKPGVAGTNIVCNHGFGLDNFRFTRAARYTANYIPRATKYPEYVFNYGDAEVTETVAFLPGSPKSAATIDGATIGFGYVLEIPKVVAPTFGFASAVSTAGAATGGEGVGNTVGLQELYNFSHSFVGAAEGLSVGDNLNVQYVAFASSGVGLNSSVLLTLSNVTVSDALSLSMVDALTTTLYKQLQEHIAISSSVQGTYHLQQVEGMTTSEDVVFTQSVYLNSSVGFADAIASQFTLYVIEQDGINLTSSTGYVPGVSVDDSVGLSSAIDPLRAVAAIVADDVTMHGASACAVYAQVALGENLTLSDDASPAQLLAALISDNIELSAYMAAPSFTTWVMNTRTTAVSEYDNFRFNSFVQVGERFLAASDTGLYWLDGDTDAGVSIPATFQPGVVQPYGNKLANVHYAYLGMRGDGSFTVTVTDEAGGTYTYDIDAASMKTGRVAFGKGLRTRYFTFKIVSDGSDFDLTNVEFITNETSRKVQR